MLPQSQMGLRSMQSSATPRAISIMVLNTANFDRIVKTMMREGVAKSEERASELIGAFVQWFSVSTHSGDKPYLMFRGPVDRTFHCFVLNTEYYASFCQRYVGRFINHNPLDADQAAAVVGRGGVEHTIAQLQSAFGADLHPELQKWARAFRAEKLTPSSVSCVQCE